MATPLRLGFAGTPEFATRVLTRLCAEGLTPKLVLTQPDRPAGRGKRMSACPVKQQAQDAGLEVHSPRSLRDPDSRAAITTRLTELEIDVLIVVAYGLIVPTAILELPPLGCINVHASLLPRWRGAAPIERALMAGDKRTGVSIMAMDEGLDTGAVYATAETPIDPSDTGDSVHDRLAELGGTLLIEVLADLPQRSAQPQTEAGACYADKLTVAEARLDWTDPAPVLARRIQALNSRMPAFGSLDGERVRLLRARPSASGTSAAPGEILDAQREGLRVATGAGTLVVTQVQLSRGKGRVLDIGDALNGNADLLAPGRRFDA